MGEDSKKTFWIIATIVALAAVSATVAYFVTRYIRARRAEDLDDLFGCDCDECFEDGCDCGCDAGDVE